MAKTTRPLLLISLLSLLLALSQAQTCANVEDPSYLLQSGKIQVFNTYSPASPPASRLHTYSVAVNYPLPSNGFQIAASISNYILTSVFGNAYDFSVRAGKGSNPASAQIILFLSDDATWTTLTISYLISSRNDLFLGSFIADGYIFQSTASNQLTVRFGVPNWSATNAQASGVAEFSGIRTFVTQPLQLSFVSNNINAQSGVMTIVISTNTAFELLYLTYYWWVNGPSLSYNVLPQGGSGAFAYPFIGIDAISGSQLVYETSGFNLAGTLSCNGQGCPNACVSVADCQNFLGVIAGNSCFICAVGQTYSNNNCQNTVSCKNNQYYDGFSCVCSEGYEDVNGACLLSCGENAYVDDKKNCQCLANAAIQQKNQGKAAKPAKAPQPPGKGGKKNPPAPPAPKVQCTKVKICGNNQILVDNVCECDNGFARINGACSVVFSCSGGAIWNPSTLSCICPGSQVFMNGVCSACPQNSAWNGTACACNSGFMSVNGACIACPAMSVWVPAQQTCICLSGFYMLNGVCITCPVNEGWNGTNCVCLSGYTRVNAVCSQCSGGMMWTGTACACPNGQYLISGICQACPATTIWNGYACVCASGYFFVNNVCQQLPANSAFNGTNFVCNPAYNLINGVCTQCWANSAWNGTNCACFSGFYPSGNSCLACTPNSAWNGQACVCLSGFFPITAGTCTVCPANSAWNGQLCACLSGFSFINGVCSQCPSGQVWLGNSCVCGSNTYMINGKCQSCPSNTAWNGTACACLSGLYPVNSVCVALPANSYYNGTNFACNPSYNLINGACAQCWANSVWSGTNCVCLSGFYASGNACLACGANSAWNGQACVCLSGFYPITAGACTACPQNTAWNGTGCSCLSGFNLINGVCSTCPSGTSWNGTACAQNCPPKSSWNGNTCVCISNYYWIQNSCLPCDINSLYNAQLQTCTCNLGFFGNYQLCTTCDSSCTSCSAAGPNSCLTCKSGSLLVNGQCQACPSNCLTCSNLKTCSQCSGNYTLTTQIINGATVIGCALPVVAPNSQLSLTGTVIANNVVYQGVTLSTLPVYFLLTNCATCTDLFTVTIDNAKLGITFAIDYVLYSQYWFVITFNYGASSPIVPQFTYEIKINQKYASYFSNADFNQVKSGSVSPVAGAIAAPGSGSISKGGSPSGGKGGKFGPNPAPTPSPTTPAPASTSDATLTLVANGVQKQLPETTIISLFG